MLMDQYAGHVIRAISEIRQTEREKILRAAGLVRDVLARDGIIYVFGCGHSHILSEEVFYRAGGLANTAPVLYPPLMLHEGAAESSRLEKQPGLYEEVLKTFRPTDQDMLVCISTSGINPVPTELVQAVRGQGVPTVAICSSAYFDKPSRAPGGVHLYQVCDVWIDNHAPYGDAALSLADGAGGRMAPLSTITGAFILNSILAEGADMAIREHVDVPVYVSGNIPGGAERNRSLIERYQPRIRGL